MRTRERLERRHDETCARLNDDEFAVVVVVAERMLLGASAYGALDLARDRRDFTNEMVDEAADVLTYGAMRFLQAALRRRRRP